MRMTKKERIIIDEFQFSDEVELKGTLALSNELDPTDIIYVTVGQELIGWIVREDLIEVAKKILELWEKKKENPT